jgi:RHS repeat-associated protein
LYDADLQPQFWTAPDGDVVETQYNLTTGRIDQLLAPDRSVTMAYSPTTGQLEGITTTGIALSYLYDGFLLTRETAFGDVNGTIDFEYDTYFSIDRILVNGAEVVDYGRDLDGLINAASTPAGTLSIPRDPASGFITGTSISQVTTTVAVDVYGELDLLSASHQSSSLFELDVQQRDNIGRLEQAVETVDGLATTYDYTYDDLGRLTDVYENGLLAVHYDYDPQGNRTSVQRPGQTTISPVHDNQDRLTQYGTLDFTYSLNGERISRTDSATLETTTYEYDTFGDLVSVGLADGSVVEYVVDAWGRRVQKKIDGVPQAGWLYQDGIRPVAELDGAGNVVSTFVYATRSNVPDLVVRGGVVYRIIADHVGSPRVVVRVSDGAVVQRMEFDEFGNVERDDAYLGFTPLSLGFAGGIYDRDTGLVHFGSREYDPEVGRWLTKDRAGFAAGDTNLYAYVGNDPVNFIDPDGYVSRSTVLDFVQSGFDTLGMIPVVGELFDIANAGISFLRGDCTGAFLSLAAAVPFAGWLATGGKWARRAKACNILCFAEGTEVDTPDGLRPIEDLAPGDLVLARDEDTGELAWQPVVDTVRRESTAVLEIELTSGDTVDVLVVTPEHPLWHTEHGWTDAADLAPGDTLSSVNGESIVVTAVTSLDDPTAVYNLQIANDHNYAVGETGAWVHNANCSGVHLHHSFPKFLGGDPKQPLTALDAATHRRLHKDMNDFLRQRVDEFGNHMRPQRGNPASTIQLNFSLNSRLSAVADFYRQFGSSYPDAARDFFKQFPGL